VIFRRTTPQIRNAGGLRDKSVQFYGGIGTPRESNLERVFETENKTLNKLKFSHLEYETNKLDWQGTEIAYLGFDELTHFTRSQFFYILSRNRSTCGVKPYVRATCNPDPDSRVKDFIARWIEPQS
jgi:hypothetical protein